MGKLIDTDNVIISLSKVFEKYNIAFGLDETEESFGSSVVKAINDIPTAYNVGKVVNQLEEEREYSYANFDDYVTDCSPCLDAEYDDYFHRGLERAIKIVEAGGKE